MSNIHHTPVATGAAIAAAVWNAPLGQLDAAIQSLLAGGLPFEQLNYGAEPVTALTIASGAITITKNRHQVDTESGAATDDLTDIIGGAVGDILFLRSVSSARVPTVKHNISKIFLSSRQDVALDDPLMVLTLVCLTPTLWAQTDTPMALALSTYNSLKLPRDLAVQPGWNARNQIVVKAAAATVAVQGIASVALSGTPTASNDTDSAYINLLSAAGAGSIAGFISATFNHTRRSHNPKLDIIFRTGAAADIANIRFWIGLNSAAITNVDSLVGVASFAGFRFSSVVGDAGFVPVCCDNAVQNVGSMVSGGTITATTRYLLSLEVNDSAGTVTFRVNNGTPSVLSANLPAAATDLGFVMYLITVPAVAKNFKFSRLAIDYD